MGDRQRRKTRKGDIEDEDHVDMTLAMSGLICHDLKASLKKGYKFDWNAALATKGNSGLFLQYSHCRLCSLERTSVETFNLQPPSAAEVDPSVVQQRDSLCNLILHVSKYPATFERAYNTLEPSGVTKYLFELSHLIARALQDDHCSIRNASGSDAAVMLSTFHCARVVLGNGMRLLGMEPLEKM